MEDNTLKLNHKVFINEYLKNGFNATLAYQVAYPSAKTSTAAANGSKLLRNTKVKEAILEKIDGESQKLELYKWKLIEDTAKKAFQDITNIAYVENNEVYIRDFKELTSEQKSLIAGVEQTKNGIKITFADQLKEKQFLNQLIREKEASITSITTTTLDTSILDKYDLSKEELMKIVDAPDEDEEGEDE